MISYHRDQTIMITVKHGLLWKMKIYKRDWERTTITEMQKYALAKQLKVILLERGH